MDMMYPQPQHQRHAEITICVRYMRFTVLKLGPSVVQILKHSMTTTTCLARLGIS
jgi:hypothetical protein